MGTRRASCIHPPLLGELPGRPPLPVPKEPVHKRVRGLAGEGEVGQLHLKNLSSRTDRLPACLPDGELRGGHGVLLSRPKRKGFYTKRRGCSLNKNRKLSSDMVAHRAQAAGRGTSPHCDLQLLKSHAQ